MQRTTICNSWNFNLSISAFLVKFYRIKKTQKIVVSYNSDMTNILAKARNLGKEQLHGTYVMTKALQGEPVCKESIS